MSPIAPSAHASLDDAFSSLEIVFFDFDGVFTDNMVYVDQDGVESVRCWRSDGLGLSRLKSVGVDALILSTEINPVVSARARKLGIPALQGLSEKDRALLQACRERTVDPANVAFVGNDINDIPAFESVGLPICVADACPEVHPFVRYRTRTAGGHGAVREVCDLVYRAKRGEATVERHAAP